MQNPENTIYFLHYRHYGFSMIELYVFHMQLIDTCKEGDGIRNNINNEKLLLYYISQAIEMFVSIAQIEALVSQEMAHD